MNRSSNTVVDLAAFSAKHEDDPSHAASLKRNVRDEASTPKGSKGSPFPASLSLRMRAWEDGTQFFPIVIAFGAVIFGLTVPRAPEAAVAAAASLGGLAVLNGRIKLALVTAILGINLVLNEGARHAAEYWPLTVLAGTMLFAPRRLLSAIIRPPRWTWVLVLALVIVCQAAAFLANGSAASFFSIIGMPFYAYLGCGLARHLAMGDARLLSWGENGLVPVTRDLLLGRITSGMLHDLAQPLNVISMANGNMGYIVDQLDIDPQAKANLSDRIARIATHTETAAYILGLFRGFGRDDNHELSQLTVRSALERAIAATKSNVRHHGVSVDLAGDGLDHLTPTNHGALEMMAVAALLNAFAVFIGQDGTKSKGQVRLTAKLSPAFVTIAVQCQDLDGIPVAGPIPDHATLWLVEQVAVAASGDFRFYHRDAKGTRFLIRLGRDDI